GGRGARRRRAEPHVGADGGRQPQRGGDGRLPGAGGGQRGPARQHSRPRLSRDRGGRERRRCLQHRDHGGSSMTADVPDADILRGPGWTAGVPAAGGGPIDEYYERYGAAEPTLLHSHLMAGDPDQVQDKVAAKWNTVVS